MTLIIASIVLDVVSIISALVAWHYAIKTKRLVKQK